MPQPSGAPFVAETLQAQKRRIAELEGELRFIERNLRQLNDLYEAERMLAPDVMAGACEGWANRISRLLTAKA